MDRVRRMHPTSAGRWPDEEWRTLVAWQPFKRKIEIKPSRPIFELPQQNHWLQRRSKELAAWFWPNLVKGLDVEERSGLWHKQAQIQSETSKIEFENKNEGTIYQLRQRRSLERVLLAWCGRGGRFLWCLLGPWSFIRVQVSLWKSPQLQRFKTLADITVT